jgi:CDGSH-type Zn-finger protein
MSQDRIRPKVVTLPPGRHAICACGQSAKAPFCDGTHKGSEFRPVIEVVEGLPKNIAWCACHTTGNAPFCDGSHTALWTDSDTNADDDA